MRLRRLSMSALLFASIICAARPALGQERAADPAGIAFFESKIRAVLAKHCYQCHADKAARGKRRLDTRDAVHKGGVSGPALVPGEPAKSLIVKAIHQTDPDLAMSPRPNAKLPDHVVADLEKRIKMGVPDPRDRAMAEKKGIDIAKGKEF